MATQILQKSAKDSPQFEGAAERAAKQPAAILRSPYTATDPQFVAAWDRLAANSSEPNPFYESWYLTPSLEQLAKTHDIQMLCVEHDGQLLGLMPLIKQRSYYGHPLPHWRNWVHANCFCGVPLIAKGREEQVWRAILDWCDDLGGLPLFLHLTHIPMSSIPAQVLAEVCGDQRSAFVVQSEDRAMLRSDLDPESYLQQSLTTKKRKELRRQHRRLGEEGELTFTRHSDGQDLDRWINAFLALEAAGWKGDAQSALAADQATAKLFRQALAGAAQTGKLERIALWLDNRPIAMLVNFFGANGAFSYKTAFDESYSRFSPGVLLQLENLALLGRDGTDWCDSCADADHPMIDKIWRERRTIARLNIGIGSKPRQALFRQIARQEGGKALDTGYPAG